MSAPDYQSLNGAKRSDDQIDNQPDNQTDNQPDHLAPKERKKERKKHRKGGVGEKQVRNDQVKIRIRYTWAVLVDHLVDVSSLAIPLFFAIGIAAACVRFWVWVLW